MDRREFTRLVRQALAHLYDLAYLQRHPLAALLAPGAAVEAGGQALHRALLEAIGALRPPPGIPPAAASWRSYLVLSRYYVEGQARSQVAEEVGISPRQFSREQLKGLQAVADLLRVQHEQAKAAGPLPGHYPSLLDAELGRLGATTATSAGTSLAETVQSAIATLMDSASHRGIILAAALPPDLPPVPMERVVLRQVLLNVLNHAIEQGAGGTIELAAEAVEERVELAIRYVGKSALPSPAQHDDDRLSLAARLLVAQGGRLRNTHDSGLSVELALPARHATKVLVIDDNPDLIQLFRRYLAGIPCRVLAASSGVDAVRIAQEALPQAITLDVMMPSQDGWEVLQTLKNLPGTKDIPVIVCSVLRERALALNLGADSFITKPVTQQDLLTALGPYL